MKKDSLLNPDELAQLLGISRRTVIKWQESTGFPASELDVW